MKGGWNGSHVVRIIKDKQIILILLRLGCLGYRRPGQPDCLANTIRTDILYVINNYLRCDLRFRHPNRVGPLVASSVGLLLCSRVKRCCCCGCCCHLRCRCLLLLPLSLLLLLLLLEEALLPRLLSRSGTSSSTSSSD
jgi:hypothetical protein